MSNSYDSFGDSVRRADEEEEKNRVRYNTMLPSMTPEQAAARQRVANELSIAPEEVDDLAVRAATAERRLRELNATPALRAWLADPYNNEIAGDDAPALGAFERLAKLPADLWRLPATVTAAFAQGRLNVERASLANRTNPERVRGPDDRGDLTPAEQTRLAQLQATPRFRSGNPFEVVAEQIPQIGYSFQRAGEAAGYEVDRGLRQIYGRRLDLGGALQDVITARHRAARGIRVDLRREAANRGLEALGTPEGMVLAPIAGLTSAFSGAGGAVRGFVGATYEQESGAAFEEFSQFADADGRRIDPNIAGEYARRVGLINAGVEFFGLGAAATAAGFGEIAKAISRPGVRAALRRIGYRALAGRVIGGAAGAGLAEGGTELTQEVVNIAMGRMAQQAQGGEWAAMPAEEVASRLWESFAVGFQVGGFFGLAGSGTRAAVVDLPAIRHAEAQREAMEALGDASRVSRLRQRSPGRFREAVDTLTRGGPIETFNIDGRRFEGYFQDKGLDPYAIADALEGVGAQSLRDAVESGGEMVIPSGTFAARIAATEHADLGQHIRFGPNQLTEAEVGARIELGLDLERAESEGARLQAERGAAEEEEAEVYEYFINQLGQAQAHDPRADQFMARLQTEHVLTTARREGIAPRDLLRLKVKGPFEAETQAGAFEQFSGFVYDPIMRRRWVETNAEVTGGAGRTDYAMKSEFGRDIAVTVRKSGDVSFTLDGDVFGGAGSAAEARDVFARAFNVIADHVLDERAPLYIFSATSVSRARIYAAMIRRMRVTGYNAMQIGDRIVMVRHGAKEPYWVTSARHSGRVNTIFGGESSSDFAEAALQFGTDVELEGLLGLVNGGAGVDEIFAHPVMQRVENHALTAKPTATPAQLEDPDWLGKREYRSGNFADAIDALTTHFTRFGVAAGKRAVFVTGHPGAGKTTFVEAIARDIAAAVPEGDFALQEIPEYEGGLNTTAARGEARMLVRFAMDPIYEAGGNVVIERIGEDATLLQKNIEELEAQGYTVEIVHVSVEGDEAVRRMVRRFLETGRYVHESEYRRRLDKPDAAFQGVVASGRLNAYLEIDANGPRTEAEITRQEGAADLADAIGRAIGAADPGRSGGPDPAVGATEGGDAGGVEAAAARAAAGEGELNDGPGRVLRGGPAGARRQDGAYFQTTEGPGAGPNPTFYSALERAVAGAQTARATPEQWRATLARAPGVKREEIEWVGVSEWLDSLGRPEAGANAQRLVSREEILNFLRDNSVVIQDVIQARGGQPLFQGRKRSGEAKGSFDPRDWTIRLFQARDLSTFLHESGHGFLETLFDLASRDGATTGIRADRDTILNWFGVSLEDWDSYSIDRKRPYHEKFARGFERYLREGKAPSSALQAAFAAFKSWLEWIYKTAAELGVELTDDVRAVMSRLIASQDAIDAAQQDMGVGAPISREKFGGRGAAADRAYQRYVDNIKLARETAAAEVQQRAIAALIADRTRWWRSEGRRIRPTVEIDVDSQPERRALDWLTAQLWRHGPAPANLDPMRLSSRALQDYAASGQLPDLNPRLTKASVEELASQAKEVRRILREGLPMRLATWVQQRGGVKDEDGEIIQALGSHRARPGLINNRTGASLDDAALAAQEAGYFGGAEMQGDLLSGYQQFAGAGARYAPLTKLDAASRMEDEGASAETIWRTTGWVRGLDGAWRWEILDDDLTFNIPLDEARLETKEIRLDDLLNWPTLFENYPQLAGVGVSFFNKRGASTGFYAPSAARPMIGLTRFAPPSQILSSLRHELQHAVQDIEGFAPGANYDSINQSHPSWQIFYAAERRVGEDWWEVIYGDRNLSPEKLADIERRVRYDIYLLEMGEAEAREVQARARSLLDQTVTGETPLERDRVPFATFTPQVRRRLWRGTPISNSAVEQVGFHGSAGPLRYEAGALFTTDAVWAAERYADRDRSRRGGGLRRVTRVDFDFQSPLVVEGSGSYNLGGGVGGMRAFLEKAREDGHDGVIFRNVHDYPGNASRFEMDPISVFVILKPDTINQMAARYIDGGALAQGVANLFGGRQYFQGGERVTINEFLDALIEDLNGTRASYKAEDADVVAAHEEAERMRDWFAERGVDINRPAKEVRAAIEKMSPAEEKDPEIIASTFNAIFGHKVFDSGADLLAKLAALPERNAAIREELKRRLTAEYGDPFADGTVLEDARKAAHNELAAQTIEVELDALARATGQAVRPMQRAARAIAQERVERMTVREIRAHDRLLAAERRASEEAAEAMARGDDFEAMRAKRHQLISHYIYRAARDAAEEVDVAQRYFRKFDSAGVRANIDNDYLDQIDALLEQFELKNISQREIGRRASLATWVQKMAAAGMDQAVTIDQRLIDDARRRPFTGLVYTDVIALRDAVRNIEHLGRLKEKLLDAADKRSFRNTVSEIVTRMEDTGPVSKKTRDEHSPTAAQRRVDFLRRANAEMTRMEFLFRHLDGGEANGPMWRALFEPFARAANVESAKMRAAAAAMLEIWAAYPADLLGTATATSERAKLFNHRIAVPELRKRDGSFSYTKAELLAVGLNWGNEGNRVSLTEGHGWTEAQIQAALDQHLDARDWNTIQAIWDLVGTFRDEAFRLQEDLTGVRPDAVEATPVQTRFGIYRGGYYPLRFDPRRDARVMREFDKEQSLDSLGSNWHKPMTKKGHLEARQGSGGRPVRLDLGVFTEHVQNVIHDVAYRRAVVDVDRIITDRAFAETFRRVAGIEMYEQLRPWLASIAADKIDPTSVLWRFMQGLRGNAAIASMGFRVSTGLQQTLGVLQAVPELGSAEMIGAIAKLMRNPATVAAKAEWILSKSEFMRTRMSTFDRDVRETIERMQSVDPLYPIRHHAFALVGVFDWAVSGTVWTAAYDKAMDGRVRGISSGDEAAAIAYGDSMVRRTQSAGLNQDLPALMRGSQVNKFWTMFFSYFSVLYNWTAYDQILGVRKGRIPPHVFAANMALIYIIAPFLAEMISGRLTPREDEDEADRDERLMWTLVKYPFMTIPVLRDIMNAYGTDFEYQLSPAGAALNTIIEAAERAAAGKTFDTEYGLKQTTAALGYAFGLPTPQAWIMVDYAIEKVNGEEEGFDLTEAVVADRR